MLMFSFALPFAGGRRALLQGLAAALLLGASSQAFAQNTTVPVSDLMAPEALPDIVQGKADAPVTVVEYASMTCTHCAAFHATTYPWLIKNYVDTGKVKFILREFPLDPRASAAFLLARCAGPDKRDAMLDAWLDKQNEWAFVAEAVEPMRAIAATFGVAGADFDDCVHNQTLYMEILEGRDNALKALDIRRTPTFYVNGRKLEGDAPLEAFDQLLARGAD